MIFYKICQVSRTFEALLPLVAYTSSMLSLSFLNKDLGLEYRLKIGEKYHDQVLVSRGRGLTVAHNEVLGLWDSSVG